VNVNELAVVEFFGRTAKTEPGAGARESSRE
jgi:hypothetical protein